MNLFADSLLDLRHERGIVSFRLMSNTSPEGGVYVHLPFADADQITRLLSSEMSKIAVVHRNWLAEQQQSPAVQEERPDPEPALGRKIGSA